MASGAVAYSWRKNAREKVLASVDVLGDGEGQRQVANLRVYGLTRSGRYLPCGKGLAIDVGQLDELESAVQALRAQVAGAVR